MEDSPWIAVDMFEAMVLSVERSVTVIVLDTPDVVVDETIPLVVVVVVAVVEILLRQSGPVYDEKQVHVMSSLLHTPVPANSHSSQIRTTVVKFKTFVVVGSMIMLMVNA